jgi:hypothetical protein
VDFLSAFPIWLRFSSLFVQLWTSCETWFYWICKILVVYWMSLKFCMCVIDILKCVMALIWFIYLMPILFYDCLKLMHDLGALYELVWTCLDFMNLIDLLPFVQMAWNLVCRSCCECCLSMNCLGIYWNVCELIWIGSFCLVLWGSKLHALYSFPHEMIMVDDMNMRPIGFDY